jgi:hypothetical protein
MIPDFETYLKESHWSEMNRRSQGITVRKEDAIYPVKIDKLFRHYHADKDLCIDGKYTFTIDELKNIDLSIYFGKGWRLPKHGELGYDFFKLRLDNDIEITSDGKQRTFTNKTNGMELIFDFTSNDKYTYYFCGIKRGTYFYYECVSNKNTKDFYNYSGDFDLDQPPEELDSERLYRIRLIRDRK